MIDAELRCLSILVVISLRLFIDIDFLNWVLSYFLRYKEQVFFTADLTLALRYC